MGQELGGVLEEGIDVVLGDLVAIHQDGPLAVARPVQVEDKIEDTFALGRRLAEHNPAARPRSSGQVVDIALLLTRKGVEDVPDGQLICCRHCSCGRRTGSASKEERVRPQQVSRAYPLDLKSRGSSKTLKIEAHSSQKRPGLCCAGSREEAPNPVDVGTFHDAGVGCMLVTPLMNDERDRKLRLCH